MDVNGLTPKILKMFNVENVIKAVLLTGAIILIILFNNNSDERISFCALDTLLNNASSGGLHTGTERNEGEASKHAIPAF